MNKQEWIKKYEPLIDADGALITYDIVEDLDFISNQESEKIWTEIWDHDSERPWLLNGYFEEPEWATRMAWYLCKKSCSQDEGWIEWAEEYPQTFA